jgi:hypothetical protein
MSSDLITVCCALQLNLCVHSLCPPEALVVVHGMQADNCCNAIVCGCCVHLQVGVVTQRRAWAHPEALTSDVLVLYERPLRVEGWDAALLATCREAAATKPQQLAAHFAAIKQQPVLCVTGELQQRLQVKATCFCPMGGPVD